MDAIQVRFDHDVRCQYTTFHLGRAGARIWSGPAAPAMRRAQRMDSSRHFSIARGSRNMTVGEGAGAAGRLGACCQSSSPVSFVTPVRSRCTPIQGGAAGAA